MRIAVEIFGQFRAFEYNLENNLAEFPEIFNNKNEVDVFILTEKTGNYSIENRDKIVSLFKKFHVNNVKIDYWEDMDDSIKKDSQLAEDRYINNAHKLSNDPLRDGYGRFAGHIWYRRYLLNKIRIKSGKIYDVVMMWRPYDSIIKKLKTLDFIDNMDDKVYFGADIFAICRPDIMDRVLDFTFHLPSVGSELWKRQAFTLYVYNIDYALIHNKKIMSSEIQFYWYLCNEFNYHNLRLDYNNPNNPFNANAYFHMKLDPRRQLPHLK